MRRTLARIAIVLTLLLSALLLLALMLGGIELSTAEILGGLAIEVAGAFITAGAVYFLTQGISGAADEPSLTDLMAEINELKASIATLRAALPRDDDGDSDGDDADAAPPADPPAGQTAPPE